MYKTWIKNANKIEKNNGYLEKAGETGLCIRVNVQNRNSF